MAEPTRKAYVERQPRICPSCNHYNHAGEERCNHKIAENTRCDCEYGAPYKAPPAETPALVEEELPITPEGGFDFDILTGNKDED